MALKQEIWWLNRIWVEHPIFWDGNNQKTTPNKSQCDCLFWSHPKIINQESEKSTSYTVIGWETKIADTYFWFIFVCHYCDIPCHNSVIENQKSSTGTQWLQKLTFWKKETPAKPQQAFSITATINDTKLI